MKYKCKKCNHSVTRNTANYGTGLCGSCGRKEGFKKGNIVQSGENNATFKGRITDRGYILVYSPEHPYRTKNKYVLEHRLVMEKKLGRYLTKDEVVHHLNGIKNDNRPENLCVIKKENHETWTLLKLAQQKIRELENKLRR